MSEDQNFVPQDDHSESEPNETPESGDAPVEGDASASSETNETVAEDAATQPGTSQEGEPTELSEGDQAILKVTELEDKLARANADYFNLQQEYNGYVKRSKAEARTQFEAGEAKVIETLLSVLDDAQLARQHNDLEGPAGTIVEKLEQTLETNFKLVRFGEEGDAFDPELHEALMNSTSPDVEVQTVAQLIQPGYKLGDKILRAARVGVVSPE